MLSNKVQLANILPLVLPLVLTGGCSPSLNQAVVRASVKAPASVPRQIVFFDASATTITADGAEILQRTRADFARLRPSKLVIVGHTDRSGNDALNAKLSAKRADAVRLYLIESGVPASVIRIAAAGESDGLVTTADGAPEAQNRRAEIYMHVEVANRVGQERPPG
jgi:outer membrane protein OmpA-like peptidoglycan-associated protein